MIVWRHDGSSDYIIKRGYKLLVEEELQTNGDPLRNTTGMITSFLTKMWALQIPAKIKFYIWKLFNNFLPTRENLSRHKLQVEGICLLCKEGEETVDHHVRSCHTLKQT
ncbi:hypothetical protein J1N35_002089 [Gossypium stocksii]|uniref:Reverse transcriptase zinc-binding domain-containing protein n=1 Tax=Gossypium stocksii TaxID=47602 RepID=A0A9D4ALX9_9ROSI|nr:hypothetical protein J1N35_002089 [Gossypium stocksii]